MTYDKIYKLIVIILLSSIICFAQEKVEIMEVTGSCSKVIIKFRQDLNSDKAKNAENYSFSPNDVDNLIVTSIGKFVVLDGLKLKKGQSYKISINKEVQGINGELLEKNSIEFTPIYEKRKILVSTVQPLRIEE